MNKVYIMADEVDGSRKVVESSELNEYFKSENIEEKIYSDFSITHFDSVAYGLTGEYLDVYCYIKNDEKMYLISRNFKKLSALCGFLNRVIGIF